MNTRIQVEHPITEIVTNTDLIKQQIKIACGEELEYEQKDIQITGHAIECRINAENPLADFAPNPGKITGYRSPGGPGVRLDSGVYMNYTIPTFYDSMISKLVTSGRTRNDAVNRMKRALSEYIILGVKTTIPFHKAILRNESFLAGDLHTHFVDEHPHPGIEPTSRALAGRFFTTTPVFLPGKSHGHRSLVGYSPWGSKELDTTEQVTLTH